MSARVRRVALALLIAAACQGTANGAGNLAGNVDCWLLDDAERADARAHGQCADAFSQNSETGAAPTVIAHDALRPERKPDPPTRQRRHRRTEQVAAGHAGRTDLLANFRRDWGTLMTGIGSLLDEAAAQPRQRR